MWFLRILGVWSLLVAMVALTIDGTRSLADEGPFAITALAEHWQQLSDTSLQAFRGAVESAVAPWLWDPVIWSLLQMPTWVFFTALGLLLYWLGQRRRRPDVYSN